MGVGLRDGGPAFGDLPPQHQPVLAARGEDLAVGTPGERPHRGFVLRQRQHGTAADCIPEMDVADPISAGQQLAVGAVGDGGDPFGVFHERVDERPGFGREDFHDSARTAECHLPLIRRQVRRQHHIRLVADLRQTLPGLHIEQDRGAVLHRSPPSGQQHSSRPAETQDMRFAFGERQRPDEVACRGIDEVYLFIG